MATNLVETLKKLPSDRTGRFKGITRAGVQDDINAAIEAALAMHGQPELTQVIKAVVGSVRRKALSEGMARDILARLLPQLGTASIVPTIRLDDVDEPRDAESYRKTLRTIWRAAVKEGRIGLDEARKAMILTKTLWRAEIEVAALEARGNAPQ